MSAPYSLTDYLVSLCIDRGYGAPPGSCRTPEQIWLWLWDQAADRNEAVQP